MDHANGGEVEPMGRQIYETFRHSEVMRVSVMRPNTVDKYELEMWERGYGTDRDITRNESVVSEEECEKQIGKRGPSRRTLSGAK